MLLNETNVRVYWNLHKGCWSVQDRKTGRVVKHVEACTLADVKFIVRPAGREKVRREGKKNVHAFAVGYIAQEQDIDSSAYHHKVSYNPYKNDFFMRSSAELGSEEVSRDFVGNIRMESEMKVLSNAVIWGGVHPRVYI